MQFLILEVFVAAKVNPNGAVRCVKRVVARERVSCLFTVLAVLFVLASGCYW